MAVVSVSGTETVLRDAKKIESFLSGYGIWYRRFDGGDRLATGASEADVLAAYKEPIEALSAEGGYTTADVIDVEPTTPGLAGMLGKFSKEHWHSEDEVRFVVAGRGVFHIHPKDGNVFRIEVVAGDMINVPEGTLHWFDLCEESRIRCIRLFQDKAGWTPHYTDSSEESRHEPLCFGPTYIPVGRDGE